MNLSNCRKHRNWLEPAASYACKLNVVASPIVEIFGHRRHVGKAREEERFGAKMLRIDVPKLGATKEEITWSSHYYGGSSIFSYTVTDERTVMNYAERSFTPAIPYRDHGELDFVDAEDEADGRMTDDAGAPSMVDDCFAIANQLREIKGGRRCDRGGPHRPQLRLQHLQVPRLRCAV